MSESIITVLLIGMAGLFTEWLGLCFGGIATLFIKNKGRRIRGSVLGFLGGVTLGIVFFDLLPEAISFANLYVSVTGAIIGLTLAVILDGRLDEGGITNDKDNVNFSKAAIFMSIGISIHNLPSGLALGSLLNHSLKNGLYLAFALIIHGIPEGLTLGVLFRGGIKSKLKLFIISVLISIPMGIGSILGCILSTPILICISLSLAATMILYVTLRETLPTANDMWKGRLTTFGNILGIIMGMLFVSLLEI